jgi:hypothetical protein
VLIKCDESHKNGASFRNKITNKIAGYRQTLAFTIVATLSIPNETVGMFSSRWQSFHCLTVHAPALQSPNNSDRHKVSKSVLVR